MCIIVTNIRPPSTTKNFRRWVFWFIQWKEMFEESKWWLILLWIRLIKYILPKKASSNVSGVEARYERVGPTSTIWKRIVYSYEAILLMSWDERKGPISTMWSIFSLSKPILLMSNVEMTHNKLFQLWQIAFFDSWNLSTISWFFGIREIPHISILKDKLM